MKKIYTIALLLSLCLIAGCNKSISDTDYEKNSSLDASAEITKSDDQIANNDAGKQIPGASVTPDAPITSEITVTPGIIVTSTPSVTPTSSVTHTPVTSDTELIFSAESGIYESEFCLTLSNNKNESIYYTLDGSDPATSDTRILYTSPIAITKRDNDKNVIAAVDPLNFSGNYNKYNSNTKTFSATVSVPEDNAVDKITVVRAVSVDDNGIYSKCFTSTFFIGNAEDHIPGLSEYEKSGKSLFVISISMNFDDLFDSKTGIYVKGDIWEQEFLAALSNNTKINDESARSFDGNYKQRGREWERECHVDMFEMSVSDTTLVLSQDAGIRIQGNYSRSDLQKGLRLFARKDYGKKRFNYPVFGNDKDVTSFKTLVLRAGGNCAMNAKFNDTYWQTIAKDMDVATKYSRPCVVYLNGEYFGLYVLEEDYSEHYFEDHYGVKAEDVVVYKGDAEKYEKKYYLDEGTLPEGVTDEGYFYTELFEFFDTHKNLKSDTDLAEFSALVDIDSVMDYFLAEVWINNKWDWPGKNWSMWKTVTNDGTEYGDGRWRFMFYDMEFGGISGKSDINTNTVKEDNYVKNGLLNKNTNNPAVLCYAYLMTNENFKNEFITRLQDLGKENFASSNLNAVLTEYVNDYSPFYEQFFARYPGTGSYDNTMNGGYASVKCLREFINGRAGAIKSITDWIKKNAS